jgi:DNA-binding response OmpR family regulator
MAPDSKPASARILVVDDEAMIAFHLSQELKKAGVAVVGPAPSVAKALTLINQEGCDFAVLDIRLGQETAEPIALELQARSVPFVIATGYSEEQVLPIFRDVPLFSKPVSIKAILNELSRLTKVH